MGFEELSESQSSQCQWSVLSGGRNRCTFLLASARRMYVVPDGQHGSSQARSARHQENRPLFRAPQGLQNSAQGFNPGNRRTPIT